MNQAKDIVESTTKKLRTPEERHQWRMIRSKTYYYQISTKKKMSINTTSKKLWRYRHDQEEKSRNSQYCKKNAETKLKITIWCNYDI